jgi:hypothetical protein
VGQESPSNMEKTVYDLKVKEIITNKRVVFQMNVKSDIKPEV